MSKKTKGSGSARVNISFDEWIVKDFPTGEEAEEFITSNPHLTFYKENGDVSINKNRKETGGFNYIVFYKEERDD